MKIAIYEIVHTECVIPLALLLKGSIHSITFFIHKRMKEDIESVIPAGDYAASQWIYTEEQTVSSLYKQLNFHIRANQYDLLWVHTNDSKHLAFALLKLKHHQMKLIINVHEINNFFRPRISFNTRQLIRFMSKKILAASADAFMVNNGKMKETIIKYHLTRKPCYILTPVFYERDTNHQPDTKLFSVVVAGTVDKRRRDYQTVLEAWIQFVQNEGPYVNAALILAGGSRQYGSDIAAICESNLLLKNTVRIFEHEIPEISFRQILANATLLLSPQHRKTSTSDCITEEYGLTKTSGNNNDAIRHAKPYIVPQWLLVPEEIESNTIRYAEEAELTAIFRNFSRNKKKLAGIALQAKENAEKFTYDSVREKVLKTITAISALQ